MNAKFPGARASGVFADALQFESLKLALKGVNLINLCEYEPGLNIMGHTVDLEILIKDLQRMRVEVEFSYCEGKMIRQRLKNGQHRE